MPPDASVSFVGYEAKEHYDFFFFNAPLTAFFKTLGMFVGEIEFADLPIDASSKLSFLTYSFLAVFIFAIGIVQMNLLNGLAVNDVGELQKTAELRSIKARCPNPPSITLLRLKYFRINTYSALQQRKVDKMVRSFACCKFKNTKWRGFLFVANRKLNVKLLFVLEIQTYTLMYINVKPFFNYPGSNVLQLGQE